MAARPQNRKQRNTKPAPAEAPTLRDPLTMFCYADLAGAIRGKGFPTRMLAQKLKSGVGWTPTNIMFTALGTIAPSPWGPHGDLMLMPDPATKVEVDFGDGSPAERFFLCDLRNTDGSAWDCCPRSFLKNAIAALEKETGLHLMATFEQEFVYSGANERVGDMYALDAVRRHGNFGEIFLGAAPRSRDRSRQLSLGICRRPVRGHHAAARCPGGLRHGNHRARAGACHRLAARA